MRVGAYLWAQRSAWKRQYDLFEGARPIAAMLWPKSGSSGAVGETPIGKSTIGRTGLVHRETTISRAGSMVPQLTYREKVWTSSGEIQSATGSAFGWGRRSWARKEWELESSAGTKILKLRVWGMLRLKGDLQVLFDQIPSEELWGLVLFAWYTVVMVQYDSNQVAASAG